jgi:four helix bundle protein
MATFQTLVAWQKAHALTLEVYRLSHKLPRFERYDLGSQMRRAALSAAANLAEGQERATKRDFQHFVTIAAGSVAEVQYYLLLVRDLKYLTDADLAPTTALAAEALRLIRALRRSLDPKPPS